MKEHDPAYETFLKELESGRTTRRWVTASDVFKLGLLTAAAFAFAAVNVYLLALLSGH